VNFLAHAYLGAATPDLLLGSLMADFVRGAPAADLREEVRAGIVLHRRIDAFTDAHPSFRESRRLVSAANRRYGGVLVDVFFDHFLARDWERYSPVALDTFAADVYALLGEREAELPETMQGAARRMIADDWLGSYARLEGIEAALGRLARRVRRENRLAEAISDLREQYAEFEAAFWAFFPEVVAVANSSPTQLAVTSGARLSSNPTR
jgi:acyl carrier protein phosphodiesterase